MCRLILAVTFLYAGVLKILDTEAFAGSIASFKLLPESWSNLLAFALPPFEIICGILVLLPRRYARVGALGIGLISVIFLVALLVAVARGIPVDCGCFGSKGPSSSAAIWLAVGRDVALSALAVVVYRWTIQAHLNYKNRARVN